MTFTSDIHSLQTRIVPDWFRDAKFGIWSHWGPQAVPQKGDWYARRMYIEGEDDYNYHVANYGHPSQFGFKDIIARWKAEKFDPEALMELYVKAGARYFVSMGVHHDNFDLWNSKHHPWNALATGPKRDIVGAWQSAARKHGLPFGVSEHLGPSYSWLSSSHGADQSGPLAGVPYDGQNPQYAALYHASPSPVPLANLSEEWIAENWYSSDPQWAQLWSRRITDLVESYQPDLLYSDGGVPFGEVGREVVARFFNAGGSVYCHKNIGRGDFFPQLGALDVERGSISDIQENPWQCDTSNGDWFCSRDFPWKTTGEVIHLLADVVSKNGSMLLNVVKYPDGSLPPQSQQFLREMAAWMAINGEAIYHTRPWKRFGEGPTAMQFGHGVEVYPFTARDIRFTSKDSAVYAILLGIPGGEAQSEVRIESLGKNAPNSGAIERVELLGVKQQLQWTQRDNALLIALPPQIALKDAATFKITLSKSN